MVRDDQLVAFIIAASLARFKRASSALSASRLSPIQIVPAEFYNRSQWCGNATHGRLSYDFDTASSSCTTCLGTAGHQKAYRNALHRSRAYPYSCIFEDDIVPITYLKNITGYVLKSLQNVEMLYISHSHFCGRYLCTHAICFSRAGVIAALNVTNVCLKKRGEGIDLRMRSACISKKIRCADGVPLFRQDRFGVKSFLHDHRNKLIPKIPANINWEANIANTTRI